MVRALVSLHSSHARELRAAAADVGVAVRAGLGAPWQPSWGEAYCARVLGEIERGETFALAILCDDVASGCVSLRGVGGGAPSPELGIWLAPRCHRQGHGSYAVRGLFALALRRWPLRRAYARCLLGNQAGQRFMASLGFTLKGEGPRGLPADSRMTIGFSADPPTLRRLAEAYEGSR